METQNRKFPASLELKTKNAAKTNEAISFCSFKNAQPPKRTAGSFNENLLNLLNDFPFNLQGDFSCLSFRGKYVFQSSSFFREHMAPTYVGQLLIPVVFLRHSDIVLKRCLMAFDISLILLLWMFGKQTRKTIPTKADVIIACITLICTKWLEEKQHLSLNQNIY